MYVRAAAAAAQLTTDVQDNSLISVYLRVSQAMSTVQHYVTKDGVTRSANVFRQCFANRVLF